MNPAASDTLTRVTTIRRAMIRAPNWVGDAVMSLPALRELRRILADAEITAVARPWVAGLFDGEGLFDDLLFVDEEGSRARRLAAFFKTARELRARKLDLAVLFPNSFGAALLARVGRARILAGFPADGRSVLLDLAVPRTREIKAAHQVTQYLRIAAAVETHLRGESRVELDGVRPRLQACDGDRNRGWGLLCRKGLDYARPVAVINPGATNSRAKRWLASRFAETADRLAEKDGFQIAIVGAPGDEDAASETLSFMRSKAALLAGETTIADLKAVLACAAVLVSNDTGAAHVAAALGVPTVVVFGPTEHESTRPLSDGAEVVRREVPCSPCMLRDCPIDHRCMTGVQADEVYVAAQRLLARTESAEGRGKI